MIFSPNIIIYNCKPNLITISFIYKYVTGDGSAILWWIFFPDLPFHIRTIAKLLKNSEMLFYTYVQSVYSETFIIIWFYNNLQRKFTHRRVTIRTRKLTAKVPQHVTQRPSSSAQEIRICHKELFSQRGQFASSAQWIHILWCLERNLAIFIKFKAKYKISEQE